MRHATEIRSTPIRDGDFDAVVVRIGNTGDSTVSAGDRYRHDIAHGLGRIPVGCQIIMCDKACNVKTVSKDHQRISVQFDTDRADVNLRIW